MESNIYLITYDISDDKRLKEVAKYLESVGIRVQNSVFEVYSKNISIHFKNLEKMIDNRVDKVFIFSVDFNEGVTEKSKSGMDNFVL